LILSQFAAAEAGFPFCFPFVHGFVTKSPYLEAAIYKAVTKLSPGMDRMKSVPGRKKVRAE
jgi:hypothetical protein